jgi:glycosyltransferase involved in cell wall biosynthesis
VKSSFSSPDQAASFPASERGSKGVRTIVVIPAFNEAKAIGLLVGKCLQTDNEVWIIDDGSTDETGSRAREAGARVIRHPKNLGKGRAIRTAISEFLKEKADYLLFMDADGQHDPKFIPSFIQLAGENSADVLLGNRMLATAQMPMTRRFTNRFMSWLVSQLAGEAIPDSQCGFRMLSRRFLLGFEPTTEGFDLESEMLIQAGRQGFKVHSLPISTIYGDETSHIRPLRDTVRFMELVSRYW